MDASRIKLTRELGIDFEKCITNERLVEIYSKIRNSKVCTLHDLASALNCHSDALRKKVFQLKQETKKLRGQMKKDLLKKTFELASSRKVDSASASSAFCDVVKEAETETLSEIVEKLKISNDSVEVSNEVLKKENEKLKINQKGLMRQNRNVMSVLQTKRKNYSILRSKYRLLSLKSKNISSFKKEIVELKQNNRSVQKDMKAFEKKKLVYQNNRNTNLSKN